jgi:ABC-type uncharacterized transport system substrate-binding protein
MRIFGHVRPKTSPVQKPAKFKLVVNIKTARALGLDIHSPCSLTPTR